MAHKWAGWLHSPCHLGVPNASQPRTKSEMAQKLAIWRHNHCRPGGPQPFRAGKETCSGPQVGRVATLLLPPWGLAMLQSNGRNQKWPTSGLGGYITLAACGVPNTSECVTK